jgi:hypothetical protein
VAVTNAVMVEVVAEVEIGVGVESAAEAGTAPGQDT